MKIIRSTGNVAISVDDVDYKFLKKYTWRVDKNGYAYRSQYFGRADGKSIQRNVYMARQILDLKQNDGKIGDHKDGSPLNNTRSNLRVVTHRQNSINKKKKGNSFSRFKGVTFHKQAKKWQAECGGKYLGLFSTESEAAKVYNRIANTLYGEYQRKEVS